MKDTRYKYFVLAAMQGGQQTENPSPECYAHIASVLDQQIRLLPQPFLIVFRALLEVAVFFSGSKNAALKTVQLLRRVPLFGSLILYHAKIAAAAELEFLIPSYE